MKKRVLLVVTLFATSTAIFAQDEAASSGSGFLGSVGETAKAMESKRGEKMLPEAGDWAIGFDAAPFLNYGGNLFNSGANTSPTANFINPTTQSITFKYFKDANTAYRLGLRIGFGSGSSTILADTSLALNGGTGAIENLGSNVSDKASGSSSNIYLSGGIEKRRGNSRIQGVYGGQLYLSLGSSATSNSYGLAMDSALVDHYTGYFGGSSRVTKTSAGSTFGFGIQGFLGVEVFVFPKLSIGAQYTWGLGLSNTGKGSTTTEHFSKATSTATARTNYTTDSKTGGSSSFGLDTGNGGGQLNIIFHF